jgi:HD-GYP domain-containing protein (c-di-GMP phosphodiesterase class II)
MGARMIEGIDFLEDARSGIRHQQERFDGRGRPDGLAGTDIPVAARVLAVVTAVERSSSDPSAAAGTSADLYRRLTDDGGRFDPAVVAATWAALDKHGLPTSVGSVSS